MKFFLGEKWIKKPFDLYSPARKKLKKWETLICLSFNFHMKSTNIVVTKRIHIAHLSKT